MVLTSKELMLIQDNVKKTQNSIEFTKVCAEMVQDSQIKNLCQQIVTEQQNDLNILLNHVTQGTVQ